MRDFMVYFEVFGRKIKMKVSASSVSEAQQKVKDKIIFHKIDDLTEDDSISSLKNVMQDFIDTLNQLGKK